MNEIDELMERIDETFEAGGVPPKGDIDKVIAYQRQLRANAEAGIKPKRGSKAKDTPGLTLSALGIEPEVEEDDRRV